MDEALVAELKTTFLFEECTDEQVRWVADHSEAVVRRAGETLFGEEAMPDAFWVLLDGEIEYSRTVGGREIVLERASQPGTWGGWLPQFEMNRIPLRLRVLRESRLLRMPKETIRYAMDHGFPLTNHLLSGIMTGARTFEGMVVQQEKLAALGRLSAGLAHELNNPAAAVRRSAAQLRDALAERERLATQLGSLAIDQRQRESLGALQEEITERKITAPVYDPLTLGEREDELQEWLEDHEVGETWELAPMLVSYGWERDALERLAEDFSATQLPVVVRWLGASSSVYGLLEEVGQSAEAMSEIVKAVKTYSYLDQAPIQKVDVIESLENTLVLLRPKITADIRITRDYADDMPRIEAYGSELNQVWTNIIDNAIDATEGQGELTLRAFTADSVVTVDVIDNGPGIPPEIQPRIFEPFFTTKAPGVGTGLGLHIAYNIVVHKHRGQIQVASKPGETRLRVVLPIRLAGSNSG